MNDAFYIAATGAVGQQRGLAEVANNIANMATTGFKRSTVKFSEIGGLTGAAETSVPSEQVVGRGVYVSDKHMIFSPGEYRTTGSYTDLAISGNGFVEVSTPQGIGYMRGGSLSVTQDGVLAVDNLPLRTAIRVSGALADIQIADNGVVTGVANGSITELGELPLVKFSNPERLKLAANGLYVQTEDSGEASPMRADRATGDYFVQGAIELSNVDLSSEMSSLLLAQRAYSLNVKLLQAADEIAGLVNGLHK